MANYQTHGKSVIQAIVSLITVGVSIGLMFQDYEKNGTLFILGVAFLSFNLGLWYNGEKVHKDVAEKRQKYKKYLKNTKDHKLTAEQQSIKKQEAKLKLKEQKIRDKKLKESEKSKKKFDEFKRKMGIGENEKEVEMTEEKEESFDDFEFKTLEKKLGQHTKDVDGVGDDLVDGGESLLGNTNNLVDGGLDKVDGGLDQLDQKKESVVNGVGDNKELLVDKVSEKKEKTESILSKIGSGISDLIG